MFATIWAFVYDLYAFSDRPPDGATEVVFFRASVSRFIFACKTAASETSQMGSRKVETKNRWDDGAPFPSAGSGGG